MRIIKIKTVMRERNSAGQCQTVWAQTGSSQKEKGFTGKKHRIEKRPT